MLHALRWGMASGKHGIMAAFAQCGLVHIGAQGRVQDGLLGLVLAGHGCQVDVGNRRIMLAAEGCVMLSRSKWAMQNRDRGIMPGGLCRMVH